MAHTMVTIPWLLQPGSQRTFSGAQKDPFMTLPLLGSTFPDPTTSQVQIDILLWKQEE